MEALLRSASHAVRRGGGLGGGGGAGHVTASAVDIPDTVVLQVGGKVYGEAPAELRRELWKSLLLKEGGAGGGENADMWSVVSSPEYYRALLDRHGLEESGPDRAGGEDVAGAIARDVHRTLPGVRLFAKGGPGRDRLWRVLRAFSLHDADVGYCQGMAFFTGILLLWLPEEHAFAALVLLMTAGKMRELYLPDMAALQMRLRVVEALTEERLPRLHAHFQENCVAPMLYSASWILSVFASEFPIDFSGRVLDVALAERSGACVVRAAIALLSEAEDELLACNGIERIVGYLKKIPTSWTPERLQGALDVAMRLSITDETLLQAAARIEAADAAEVAARETERASQAAQASASSAAAAEPQPFATLIPGMDLLGLDDAVGSDSPPREQGSGTFSPLTPPPPPSRKTPQPAAPVREAPDVAPLIDFGLDELEMGDMQAAELLDAVLAPPATLPPPSRFAPGDGGTPPTSEGFPSLI